MARFKYIKQKLSEKLELPEDTLGGIFRMQIIGESAILCGCKKLLKYKSEEIVALTQNSVVSFFGEHLKCAYFFENNVEICGKITKISFEQR